MDDSSSKVEAHVTTQATQGPAPQSGSAPQSQYTSQSGYAPQPGYAPQNGYAPPPSSTLQQGYAPQPAYGAPPQQVYYAPQYQGNIVSQPLVNGGFTPVEEKTDSAILVICAICAFLVPLYGFIMACAAERSDLRKACGYSAGASVIIVVITVIIIIATYS